MKKIVLISILIPILIVVGCEKTQEIPDKETSLEEAEKGTEEIIKEAEPNEEAQEEVTKGKEIDFEDFLEEIKSKKIFKRTIFNRTMEPHYQPSEYILYYAKAWGIEVEDRELYIIPEFTIYQIVDKEKMIKDDSDLREFVIDNEGYLDSVFQRRYRNFVNYFEYLKRSIWKIYAHYNISEIESEYGKIFEISIARFLHHQDKVKYAGFIFEHHIACSENMILLIAPDDPFKIAGEGTPEDYKKSFYRLIETNRDELLDKTKKMQQICKNISYVNFKECTKEEPEKCKKYYYHECKNNDGKCEGYCNDKNDNDCESGNLIVADVKFKPEKIKPNDPIYLDEITLYNPSDYAIDVTNITIAFYTFKTRLPDTYERNEKRKIVREKYPDWIYDKKWVYQWRQDGWWTRPHLRVPALRGIIPAKSNATFKTEDIRYKEDWVKELGAEYREPYRNGMISKMQGTGNITIIVYPNFYLWARETNMKDNEFRKTFLI